MPLKSIICYFLHLSIWIIFSLGSHEKITSIILNIFFIALFSSSHNFDFFFSLKPKPCVCVV